MGSVVLVETIHLGGHLIIIHITLEGGLLRRLRGNIAGIGDLGAELLVAGGALLFLGEVLNRLERILGDGY